MNENSQTTERLEKDETAPVEKGGETVCVIHKEIKFGENVGEIRKRVCVPAREFPFTEFEGGHYCLFHLPTADKGGSAGLAKFAETVEKRMTAVYYECLKIEKKFPGDEDKQTAAKVGKKLVYDFRYVCFPGGALNLDNRDFLTRADFSSATFSGITVFKHSKFKSIANFDSATFNSHADFSFAEFFSRVFFTSAKFCVGADFKSITCYSQASFVSANFAGIARFDANARFIEGADFIETTFSGDAIFSSATFEKKAYFSLAAFSSNVYFNSTNFDTSETTSFYHAVFDKAAYFNHTEFRNAVSFKEAVFGKDSYILFLESLFAENADFSYCSSEGYLRFKNLWQKEATAFDFQEAEFEKASRISFHTCRLKPNWFINVDPRKMIFIDIDWANIDWKPKRNLTEKLKFAVDCLESGWRQAFGNSDEIVHPNIAAELNALEKRGIKEQKKRILHVAISQLAVNAEENNRYEEASRFRYMAMETRRLDFKGIKRFLKLHWFYKWSSGYGESWSRAAVVLLGILLLFGVLFALPPARFDHGETADAKVIKDVIQTPEDWTKAYDTRFKPLGLGSGLIHSVNVAALQRPDPKPAPESLWTRALIILETIFAPLQAALLALAIRRKFMR